MTTTKVPNMSNWRTNHGDYLLEIARSVAITYERFRWIPDHEAGGLIASIRQAFGTSAPWWREPVRDLPIWAKHLPESESYKLISKIVPVVRETVWFLAMHYGESPLLFEGIPEAIEQLLGETHLFEYAVVSKQLDWLIGEEDHSTFVVVGQKVIDRLHAVSEGNVRSSLTPPIP